MYKIVVEFDALIDNALNSAFDIRRLKTLVSLLGGSFATVVDNSDHVKAVNFWLPSEEARDLTVEALDKLDLRYEII